MRGDTRRYHEQLELLGAGLGFQARREVSGSVLSLVLDDALTPRSDLMWSLPLTDAQARALTGLVGRQGEDINHLPIVGIEVEGSGPSTKTLTSDVINILALGTRLGFLVVADRPPDNMYRRAVRILRTMRRAFGDIGVLPVEADSLTRLAASVYDRTASDPPAILSRLPAGGEILPWADELRAALRQAGHRAGYVVAEPYVPPVLRSAWEWEGTSPRDATAAPGTDKTYSIRRWSDYYTASQIDMAWLLPLPRGLRQLLDRIVELDPLLLRDGFVFPELYDHVPVIGFEFESATGKHAGGGLANLGAYNTIGVAVSPKPDGANELKRTLARYQPTLGLRNVIVRSAGELMPR
jgi:hypothetical protein